MNPAKIKKLAKQGDPEAIAVLLNGSLQRQGVTAKVVLGYLITFIYYIVSESIWSKSPAKFITKTKVVNNRNKKPSFGQIIGRTAARFIPFEAFSFLSSKHPRGWHDKISGTKVVDDPIQS